MGTPIVSVAGEHDLPPIITKHGECIKTFIATNFPDITPIGIHCIHVERKSSFVFMVAAEDDPSIGQKVRRPIGLSQVSELFLIAAICIGNKDFHLDRRNYPLP